MPQQLPKVTLGPGQFIAVYGKQPMKVNKYSDHVTVVAPGTYIEPTPPPPVITHSPVLVYSGPTHDSPKPVAGVTLVQILWLWVQDSAIASVAWTVDGVSVPGITRDLGGTNTDGTAKGYDTTKLSNATHEFKAVVSYSDGSGSVTVKSNNVISNTIVTPPPVDPPPVEPPPVVIPPPGSDPSVPAGFTTIQNAINAMPAGAVFGIPAGTYSETATLKSGQRIVPIGGPVIIDGGNSRQYGIVISQPNVTIDRGSATDAVFEVRNHRPPYQRGAVYVSATTGFLLRGIRSHDNPGAGKGQDLGNHTTLGGGISITHATGHVEDVEVYSNETAGIHVNGYGDGYNTPMGAVTFSRCYIHGNNPGGYNLGWHSGGLKVTECDGFTFEDGVVSGNRGDGIWCDINVINAGIRRTRFDHNTFSGIHYEISDLGTFEDNVLWENGWERKDGWGWGASIQLVESRRCNINRNIVAWSNRGISFLGNVDPARKGAYPVSAPGSYDALVPAGNTVISSDGYLQFYGGGFTAIADATGKYWSAVAPIASSGPTSTINLTTAQRDAILTAAGIPLGRS